MKHNHCYADGTSVESGDVCEFDLARGEWDKELDDYREVSLEGEVIKLLPKGRIRIRWEDENNPTRQGDARIMFAVRESSQCHLSRRSM